MTKDTAQVPLVVDLDGTLVRSDLLLESGLALLRANPLRAVRTVFSLVRGKAAFKERLAREVSLDPAALPYNQQVLERLRGGRSSGRVIILATASHRDMARAVAAQVGGFDQVLATEGGRNFSARVKRDVLVGRFGRQGFDYMGNSRDDLPVWAAARRAIVVDPEPGVERRAISQGNVADVLRSADRRPLAWVNALRVHQWVKNLLVLVPLLASHKALHPDLLPAGLLAVLCFCLCASGAYLLNDLLDLDDDRRHSSKRLRPFASGALPLAHGLAGSPLLLLGSFALSIWLLPAGFTAALAGYFILTTAYSLALKRLMMVDVITLALLYTLRIIAGALAVGVPLTFWVLAFAMFLFLSLALVKRYAELRQARSLGRTEKTRGRGYYPDDLEMVSALGAAAGYLSVLVLALYIQEDATQALYSRPEMIWPACVLLLFWVSRTWLITHRGRMHEDPVVFAVKDPISLAVGVLFAFSFWLAS